MSSMRMVTAVALVICGFASAVYGLWLIEPAVALTLGGIAATTAGLMLVPVDAAAKPRRRRGPQRNPQTLEREPKIRRIDVGGR